MELDEARTAITSRSDARRLEAARVLAGQAGPDELQLLQDRVALEEVPWVRRVLRDAVERLVSTPDQDEPVQPPLDIAEEVYQAVYSRALEEVTHQVVHEIRTIVGAADYYAGEAIGDYESSRVNAEFARLRDALHSVSLLGEAASVPTFREFDLAELIAEVVREERKAHEVEARYIGKPAFLVTSDKGLVEMVLRNAVRNACEATASFCARTNTELAERPITVSWQLGDRECVVSVLDAGPGLPPRRSRAWEIGVTTKKGHSGIGLPTARQAARSLNGRVELRPSQRGGALFEFRFPIPVGA